MPVIEFGLMGVKPNHAVTDPTTTEGQILHQAWESVSTTPNGPRWVYGGVEVDNPERLWGFFEFESVKQHEDFAKTFGGEAVKDLPKILTHSEFQKHIQVEPSLRFVLEAPVTEVILVYFSSEISDAQKVETAKLFAQIIEDSGLKTSADVKAVSSGWSVENDFPVLGGKEGRVGSVFGIFVGWESVGARTEVEGKQAYGGYAEKLSEVKGVNMTVRRLVACKEFGGRKG